MSDEIKIKNGYTLYKTVIENGSKLYHLIGEYKDIIIVSEKEFQELKGA